MSVHRTHTVILDWLEEELRAGTMRVGDKLPGERALAERFGISRASVREATRILDAMGLLRTSAGSGPNAGAVLVSRPSAALSWALRMHIATRTLPMADIVATRVMLETDAARAAALREDEEPAADVTGSAAAGEPASLPERAGTTGGEVTDAVEDPAPHVPETADVTGERGTGEGGLGTGTGTGEAAAAGRADGGGVPGGEGVPGAVDPAPAGSREPAALTTARERALAHAAALLERMDDPTLPAEQFHHLDAEFHVTLASLGGNVVVTTVMDSLRQATVGYVSETVATLEDWPAVRAGLQADHRRILDAVRARDGEAAAQALREHILGFAALSLREDG